MDNFERNYFIESEMSLNWELMAERLQQEQPRTRNLPEYKSVRFLIFPDDIFLEYWNILIILLLLYTGLVIPYRLTLQEFDDTNFVIWDSVVDIIYFIDIIINCFLAFKDSEGILVTDKGRIFKRYLTSWLLVDLSSCIPIQLIMQSGKNYSKFIRVGRLPRLYRLIKMAKLIRMLKVIKSKTQIMKYITGICKVDAGVERLIWFLIAIFMMIHILACLWIFIGFYYSIDTYDNWIYESELMDAGNVDLYITALYWCVTTLATVGYGDLHPYNTAERLYTSGVMLIGIFIYSYIIGSLTNLLSNLDSRKAKLTKKLEILDNLTQEYGFNQIFYKKLCLALEYQHLNNKQELNELLEDIPAYLKTQLLVIIYQKLLESNTFFENKPPHFAAFVAPLLKPVKYEVDEYIYKQNDYAKEMYFIVKGEVAMITEIPDLTEEVPFNTLGESYYFGETDILFSEGKLRKFSTKAMEKCELLSFEVSDFENMLETFEEESIDIMSLAHQRNLRLDVKQKESIKLYVEKNVLRKIRSYPVVDISGHFKLADIIKQSRAKPIPELRNEPEEDGRLLSTDDDHLNVQQIPVSRDPSLEVKDEDFSSANTLYNTIVEDKLVKEEDNLKISKNTITEIEKCMQECFSILKNITEHFGIEFETIASSNNLKYE